MKNDFKTILSLDAGGIKGLYSILIIDGIEENYQLNFNTYFDYYAGTSIGAVIAIALAQGVSSKEILLKFSSFKDDLHKGHIYLTNRLYEWIDYLFGKERLISIKPKFFIPLYNFSNKELSFFCNNSALETNILIADVLKAACSDIRIVEPYKINSTKFLFADAGFFAYDPAMFFVRSKQIELNNNIKILSIGSGLIENISSDLSLGRDFDIIYDTFLYDQFQTTSFFFETIKNQYKLVYKRISEFPILNEQPITIDYIIELAQNKLSSLTKYDFDSFL